MIWRHTGAVRLLTSELANHRQEASPLGPATVARLLQLAAITNADAFDCVKQLPGVQSLPHTLFVCLLRHPGLEGTAMSRLLQLPQAQALSSEEVASLLMQSISNKLADVMRLLLSLPAASALSEQQVVDVLTAAMAHDGVKCAEANNSSHPESFPLLFRVVSSLSSRLSAQRSVKLLQLAVHYSWDDLVLDLLVTEPVFESLIPDRLANVVSLLVSSGGWHRLLIENNDTEAGFSETLGHRILDLGNVQELETQAVFPVMRVLAQQGYSFSDVLWKVPSAQQVDEEQLVELLGLALGNHEWDDVATLACSCPAAHHLDSDLLLQAATQVLSIWPRSRAHTQRRHAESHAAALRALLSLSPAVGFSPRECLALARSAVQAGNVCAFVLLYKHLPQLEEAEDRWTAAEVLHMLQQTLKTGEQDCYMLGGPRPSETVALLASFPAAGHVTSADMQQLLTQALQQGTHVMRDVCEPQGSTTAELLKLSRASRQAAALAGRRAAAPEHACSTGAASRRPRRAAAV